MKWNCDSESFDVTHHNKILKASSESPWRANMRTYEVNLYVTWVWREKRFPAHNTSLFSRKKNRQQNAVDSGKSAAILQSRRIASGLRLSGFVGYVLYTNEKFRIQSIRIQSFHFGFRIRDEFGNLSYWIHVCLLVNTKTNPVLNRS